MSSRVSNRIAELASTIATDVQRLQEHFTSSEIDNDDSANTHLPPDLDVCRFKTVEAATELKELLMQPFELIMHQHEHPFWFYDVLRRFDIPKKVPLDHAISYSELSSLTNLSKSTLKSVIRYAIAHRVFTEKTPEFVSHNAASKFLATDPTAFQFTGFVLDEMIRPAVYSGEALEKCPDSDDPSKTAFALGEKTSAPTYWAHLAQDPQRLDRFVKIMAQGQSRDIDFISKSFPWSDVRTVVELGASQGELAKMLAERFSNLEITAQDLPSVIEACSSLDPAPRVKLMAHDFFQQQPIKGADVYIYRHCFHDWSDEKCLEILKALIPALKSGARVLAVDAILPEPGTVPVAYERMIRSVDNNMRHVLGAKERDLSEWKELFASADGRFRFVQAISQPPGTQCGVIEVVWESS